MIRIEHIPPSAAWQPDATTVNSFMGGIFRPCKILGHARLVRLLSHAGQAPEGQMYEANRMDGSFWFDEQDFLRVRSQAEADLRSQGGTGDWHQRLKSRIGMYMRHQFRDLLAVRRDWTPSFDYFVLLVVPAGEAIVALEGWVGDQPVYSDEFPGSDAARKAGVRLAGGLKQYVIRFDFAANRKALAWFDGPPRSF